MISKEPVALFSGVAALVGLVATNLCPDTQIPEEVTVLVVAAVAGLGRQWVTLLAKHVNAIEEASRAARAGVRRTSSQHRRPAPRRDPR